MKNLQRLGATLLAGTMLMTSSAGAINMVPFASPEKAQQYAEEHMAPAQDAIGTEGAEKENSAEVVQPSETVPAEQTTDAPAEQQPAEIVPAEQLTETPVEQQSAEVPAKQPEQAQDVVDGDVNVRAAANLDAANIALGKKATAYAAPVPHWGADKLTDGIVNRTADKKQQSRWSSEEGAPGWVDIDLQQEQSFKQITLEWELGNIKDYHIEAAGADGQYRTIYTAETQTETRPISETIELPQVEKAQHIKLCIDEMMEGVYPSLSLYEIKVWAPDVATINKAQGKTVTASQGDGAPLVDGKPDTAWKANQGDSFTVDLGHKLAFNRFKLNLAAGINVNYHIEISNDKSAWNTIYTAGEHASNAEEEMMLDELYTAQYVKVVVDQADAALSIHEFGLYQDLDFVSAIDRVKEKLDAITVGKNDITLELPSDLPASVEVTYGGTDYEQVIDANRKIIRPLTETDVAVEFKIKSKNNPDETVLHEVKLTVPGLHTKAESQNEKPKVIPELQQWFGATGEFTVRDAAKIWIDPALPAEYDAMAQRFAADYEDIVGLKITAERGNSPAAGDFYFKPAAEAMEKETYELSIGDSVEIRSSDVQGGFWSTRSILQILKQTKTVIPKGEARDYPKYKIRSLSLDVGRRYIPLHFLDSWVSQMSWYKMNDFNLHLTDNTFDLTFGGFPLESEVPNLTNPEGMYYTKDEFRDFQKRAKEQGVMIVPEFDTPGHSLPFTEARPDLARPGKEEYLDVQNSGTAPFVQSVFSEYLDKVGGKEPVFLEDAVINIGTDEYKGGGQEEKEAFRKYQDTMLKFILSKNHIVRAWGSQTENAGTTPVQVDDVQLYMWYGGYANPRDMYELGYEMININDGDVYIVPGLNYYYDYLDLDHLYKNWQPNKLPGFTVPAGDPQMLGGAYALWNDATGGTDNGASDIETFDRLFHALPVMAARTWGEGEDNTLDELTKIAEKTLYAPNTNPTYEVESNGTTVANYTFDDASHLQDSSENDYDIKNTGKNVTFSQGHSGDALTLAGGTSYVETPLTDKGVGTTLELGEEGVGTTLDFWVKRDANSGEEEQVLFESEIGQIKAVQKGTGKFGFSREARDYSFDYTLPKDTWVRITLVMEFEKTTLYVNAQKVQTLERITKKAPDGKVSWEGKWATLVTPLMRIGSETNAFKGQIDEIIVHDFAKAPEESSGSGSVTPSAGKPSVSVSGSGGKIEAHENGSVTITPDVGYHVENVIVNGVSKGPVTSLRGLNKNDKVVVKFAKDGEKPSPEVPGFSDVAASSWYSEAVDFVVKRDLFQGTSENSFSPNATMTRGMLVTVLHRLAGKPTGAESNQFVDVGNQYYADAVKWAVENSIVNGTNKNHFSPNAKVTREQMATILYRYASKMGYDVTQSNELNVFADASQVSPFAENAMEWANAAQLINGTDDKKLNPKGSAARAEVAAILMRFCNKYSV